MKVRTSIASSLIAVYCVSLSGCAGTHANPVPFSQHGDEKMSCNAIKNEMVMMQEMAEKKKNDATNQTVKNAAAVATGIFLIVPLFFVDPHNNNSVEEQAALNRYKKLQTMGSDKGCF